METPKGLLACPDQNAARTTYFDQAYNDARTRELKPGSTLPLKKGTIVCVGNEFYALEEDVESTVSVGGFYEQVGVRLPTGEVVYVPSGSVFGEFDEERGLEQIKDWVAQYKKSTEEI